MRLVFIVLFLGLLGLSAGAMSAPRFITVASPAQCKNIALDDQRWAELAAGSVDANRPYCLHVQVERPSGPMTIPAIKVSLLGAYHLYWNGRHLGDHGVPAYAPGGERPARLGSLHLLPRHDLRSTNTLIIAASSAFIGPRIQHPLHGVRIGDYQQLAREPLLHSLPFVAAWGVMILMALYMLIVYALGGRRPAHLLFSLLCVVFAFMLMTELWKDLIGYTYDKHVLRLATILVLSAAIAVLLPLYYASFYQKRVAPTLVGAGATVLFASVMLIDSWDLSSLVILFLGVLASLFICFRAWRDRLAYSRINAIALSMLACTIMLDPASFADRSVYLAFPILALALLLTISLESRQRRHQALRAVQLENALLRQSLQPHFLMNSLTMVMEWIEQHPPKALRFIEALADEFRQLNACADKQLIPLSAELALCRSHLAIMGHRTGYRYELNASGADPALPIPPALLHTLIENAFSHNKLAYDATFTLTQYQLSSCTVLRFDAPFDGGRQHAGGGLGLAYVRARLDDSFGHQWRLGSEAVQGKWRTEITFVNGGKACVS